MDWLDRHREKSWVFRPHQHVLVVDPVYQWKSVGEVISWRTPNNTYMVRRIPGNPTTMEEMHEQFLSPAPPIVYVNYIRLRPDLAHASYPFPIEALRAEGAQPANFYLEGDERNPRIIMRDNMAYLLIAVTTGYRDEPFCRRNWIYLGWDGTVVHKHRVGEELRGATPLDYIPDGEG